jgi:hypothetical protein
MSVNPIGCRRYRLSPFLVRLLIRPVCHPRACASSFFAGGSAGVELPTFSRSLSWRLGRKTGEFHVSPYEYRRALIANAANVEVHKAYLGLPWSVKGSSQ